MSARWPWECGDNTRWYGTTGYSLFVLYLPAWHTTDYLISCTPYSNDDGMRRRVHFMGHGSAVEENIIPI